MSWHEITLGNAIHVKHGFAFKSQYFSDSGEFVVLTPGNFNEVGGFRLRPRQDRFYTGDIPRDYVLNKGDLIIAMTEQGPGLLGSSALVPESGKYLHNQRLGLIQEVDDKILDRHFLYYLFNTSSVRGQINGSATGTKVRHTAPDRIHRVKVTVPKDVHQQRRVASILSTYDSLIEANRRRLRLLEQAAWLIYKEWCIHLQPPRHNRVKVKDGVPNRWKSAKLGDIADITMGQSPKSVYYNEEGNGLPFHQGVTNFGIRFPSHNTYCTVKHRLAAPGDILFSVRAPVGRVNITIDTIVIGRGLAAIRSKNNQQNLLYYALKTHFFKEDMIGGGSIFAAVTKKVLHDVKLVQPSTQISETFIDFVRPLDIQIEVIHRTIDAAVQTRTTLLPRLMDGRLKITNESVP